MIENRISYFVAAHSLFFAVLWSFTFSPTANGGEGGLVYLDSARGQKMLLEATAAEDYWQLSLHFVTQKNLAYCGVASSVMVLNAMDLQAPVAPAYAPFQLFTQENFFNDRTAKVLRAEKVAKRGMTLDELGNLLAAHQTEVRVYHSSESNLNSFRVLLIDNLKNDTNYVIVNYLRKALGQKTGGHISPLAAYNKPTDSVLIYDVSRYKYPPVWVPVKRLWLAMDTMDQDSKSRRGFLTVSKKKSVMDSR